VSALTDAIKALIPTSDATGRTWVVYHGDATGVTATTPHWVVMNAATPGGSHRSEAQTRQAGDLIVTVRAVAVTEGFAGDILRTVLDALDGARPIAAGWSCGALIPISDPRTDVTDFSPTSGGSRRVWQATATFRLTASPLS